MRHLENELRKEKLFPKVWVRYKEHGIEIVKKDKIRDFLPS
jgi:hypothetical protein